MEDEYSENSACTNRLGTCIISDPEDIAIFEENMHNPVWSDELKEFYRDAQKVWDGVK